MADRRDQRQRHGVDDVGADDRPRPEPQGVKHRQHDRDQRAGADIIHAVPLTLVAAIGHSWLGNVDAWLLASLLLGSIPGIVAGSLVAGRIDENLVRYALAAMLVVSAVKMIAG